MSGGYWNHRAGSELRRFLTRDRLDLRGQLQECVRCDSKRGRNNNNHREDSAHLGLCGRIRQDPYQRVFGNLSKWSNWNCPWLSFAIFPRSLSPECQHELRCSKSKAIRLQHIAGILERGQEHSRDCEPSCTHSPYRHLVRGST